MLGTPGTEWQVLRAWERIGRADEARDWHHAYLSTFLSEAGWESLTGAGWHRVASGQPPGKGLLVSTPAR
ncbi:MAG: hypothetical protein Fur0032_05630 [Terrimicrobiaceae bacterium]